MKVCCHYSSPNEMHRTIGPILASLLILAWTVSPSHAYYCDDNLCSNEQFCCGENICCNYVNSTIWFFICLLISAIVIGFVLSGLIKLAMALILVYYARHRSPDDVEQNDEEDHEDHIAPFKHDLSLLSLGKHFVRTLLRHSITGDSRNKANCKSQSSASSASSTLISFAQTDRKQFN